MTRRFIGSVLLIPNKTSSDMKRDMIVYDVHLSNSSIKRCLIKAGRVARRLKTKQLLTKKIVKDLFGLKNIKTGLCLTGKEELFSYEHYFLV